MSVILCPVCGAGQLAEIQWSSGTELIYSLERLIGIELRPEEDTCTLRCFKCRHEWMITGRDAYEVWRDAHEALAPPEEELAGREEP